MHPRLALPLAAAALLASGSACCTSTASEPPRVAGASPAATGGCRATGCSGQVCADADVMTTCEWKPEYACYREAVCARGADGACGWVQDAALRACLERARGGER